MLEYRVAPENPAILLLADGGVGVLVENLRHRDGRLGFEAGKPAAVAKAYGASPGVPHGRARPKPDREVFEIYWAIRKGVSRIELIASTGYSAYTLGAIKRGQWRNLTAWGIARGGALMTESERQGYLRTRGMADPLTPEERARLQP